ncbi:MFS transporter [Martelella alba]|uniref:MFS transporter n=1 Tax=Martelella alba TaxID=2590451 RepID=A0ABY2SD94_9HYPH|nr:MFS transporter [Martelella alba]TKI02278.1 MFS transporter [Martelella alba]
MPIALYALAAAAFAIGMAEFVVVGILPAIATDMNVDIPTAGQLVSLYALGVAVAAPLLTALTGRMDRRVLSVGLMVIFVAANLIAWLADSYTMLLVGRVLAGAVQGVFYSMATVLATNLVKKEKSGQAIGIVFMGLTVALVSGVPLGTFLTEIFNWRAAFLFICALGLASAVAQWILLPKKIERPEPASLGKQLSVIAVPRMLLVFVITCLGYGGAFIAYTYLSEILQKITGFSQASVSGVLIIYGVAVTLGNIYCAKLADKKGPVKALIAMFVILSVVLALVSTAAPNPYLMVPLIMVWGAMAFGSIPVLQLYVVQQAQIHAPHSVDASSSMNISAFNAGIALGAWAGGLVVAHYGLLATGAASALVVAVSVLLVLISGYWDKRHHASQSNLARNVE